MLVEKDPAGGWTPRVIGSIVEYLYAPDDPEAVIEKMADPATRIVSLTVTEGGYNVAPGDRGVRRGQRRRFGPTSRGTRRRPPPSAWSPRRWCAARARGIAAVHDHVLRQHPGQRACGGQRCSPRTPGSATPSWGTGWPSNVAFPNSMVDRITPVTTDEDRAQVAERFGVDGRLAGGLRALHPVGAGGPASASAGRPLEQVGVQVVADVEPYELMKLRLLNASHQALCYFGYLAGYRLVHEVAQDPLFADFLLAYMDREATPTLAPVPGVDLTAYKHQLIERFSNAAVRDTVARLCAESSDRIPKWLLPVIRENLAAGRDVRLAAAVVASWARYAEGVDEQGEPITVVDRLADALTAIAQTQRERPAGLRGQPGAVRRPGRPTRLHRALPGHPGEPAPRGARATLESLVGSSVR